MARNVPRLASYIDLGGLVLFVAGAACYFRAFVGMRHLEKDRLAATGKQFAALTDYNSFLGLSRAGIILGAISIAAFIVAAIIARRKAVIVPAPVLEPVAGID